MKLAATRQDGFGNQYIGAAGERAVGDQHLKLLQDRTDGFGKLLFDLPTRRDICPQ